MKTKKAYMTPEINVRRYGALYREHLQAIEKARAEPNEENIKAFFETRKAAEDFLLERYRLCTNYTKSNI
jgi:hypothetical protein